MSRPKMVDWYAPLELTQTGVRTALSTALGSMLDSRRIAALEAQQADEGVYPEDESKTYAGFDFMADTGDGWDSTYSMACLLTRPQLAVSGVDETLERPRALVLGGDEVYPVASEQNYADRLVSPFKSAWETVRRLPDNLRDDGSPKNLPRSDLFMIPGNHDWYDALGSFSHRFFKLVPDRLRGAMGSFQPRQSRPYFVLRLDQGWELWGVDIQLGGNLDRAQNDFFYRRADELSRQLAQSEAQSEAPSEAEAGSSEAKVPKPKVVIALAEPDWTYGNLAAEGLRFHLGRFSGILERKGIPVRAVLAGDVHNYQRYEEDRGEGKVRHHVVAGGGGAFLHPTHGFPRQPPGVEPRVGEAKALYPPPAVSRRLSHRILAFPAYHRGMWLLLGALAAIFFWHGDFQTPLPLYPVAHPLTSLGLLGVIAATLGLALSARRPTSKVRPMAQTSVPDIADGEEDGGSDALDVESEIDPEMLARQQQEANQGRKDRIHGLFGLVHGVVQVCTMVFAWFLAQDLVAWLVARWPEIGDWRQLLVRLAVVVLAGLLCSFVFGLYLWLALNVGHFHHNEAFSSLSWPHHKNFLRCRVTDESTLEVYALGVERTGGEDDEQPMPVHLVERFEVRA